MFTGLPFSMLRSVRGRNVTDPVSTLAVDDARQLLVGSVSTESPLP